MGRPNGDGTYGPNPMFVSSTTVDSLSIDLKLNKINPWLSEYEILVAIREDDTVLGTARFIDPGGISSVFIFRDKTDLTVQHGAGELIRVNPLTKECSSVSSVHFSETDEGSRIGKFCFRFDKEYPYRFELCSDDETWIPKPRP